MTSGSGAPPLPPPQPPAVAARAVSEAARAVADAWAQPMDPAEHNRAISQLYSILRDLGIATRGLARYRTTGNPAWPALPGLPAARCIERGAAPQSIREPGRRPGGRGPRGGTRS